MLRVTALHVIDCPARAFRALSTIHCCVAYAKLVTKQPVHEAAISHVLQPGVLQASGNHFNTARFSFSVFGYVDIHRRHCICAHA